MNGVKTRPETHDATGNYDLQGMLEACHEAAYGWAVTCCRNDRERAQETLQKAYWKILTGRARYNGRSTFKTWLFSVIRRTAADDWRTWFACRLRMLPIEATLALSDPNATPAEAAASHQAQSIIRDALSSVARRQREVLHLVFYENMTLHQAASVMGISVGSASRHYHRGKLALRQKLSEMGVAS